MYIFTNDYAEGAHPAILQKMLDTNFEQQTGYGEDQYSIAAKKSHPKRDWQSTRIDLFYCHRNTDQPACDILSPEVT